MRSVLSVLSFRLTRFEVLRLVRDRSYWFWSLVGIPILAPLLILSLSAVTMLATTASSGTGVQSDKSTGFVLSVYVDPELLPLPFPDSQIDLEMISVSDALEGVKRDAIVSLSASDGRVAAEVSLNRRLRPFQVNLVRSWLVALETTLSSQQRSAAGLSEDAFDRIENPLLVTYANTPRDEMPMSSTLALVLWFSIALLPYLQIARIGSTAVATDQLHGALWPLSTASAPLTAWIFARWAALCVVASCLLVYYAILATGWLCLYGAASDWFVGAGGFESLSPSRALEVRRYLVDLVTAWRSFGVPEMAAWLLVTLLQLYVLAAAILALSIKASTVERARLLETLPFMIVLFLPLVFHSAIADGLTQGLSWIPSVSVLATATELQLASPNGGGFSVVLVQVLYVFLLLILCTRILSRQRLSAMA